MGKDRDLLLIDPGHIANPKSPRPGLMSRWQARALRLFGGSLNNLHTSFDAPEGFAFLTSASGAFVTYNAYWDGTNWHRYNIGLDATALNVTAAGAIQHRYAAAGANPIVWTTSNLVINADSGWLDLGSYGANWSSYVATDDFKAQYRKFPNGLVFLRGLVKKSVALVLNEVIATLPAGFRPGAAARQQLYSQANAAASQTVLLVTGGGNIILNAGGSNLWISLDGISFFAEL